MRNFLVLAPNSFLTTAKTAHGVIRYSHDAVAAVVDPDLAGRTIRDVMPQLNSDAPIVSSVREGLSYHPTSLLVGTAPMGGQLPPEWREEIRAAIAGGLEIVSGLHEFISEDAELAAEAAKRGVPIVDVRKAPETSLFSGHVYDVTAPILLTVGNECAVGKMTASLEIVAAARHNGTRATFVPTGQTGIMVAGWGIAIDRVISDFAAGAAEQLVLQAAEEHPDLIVVEGQGAINHPAYGAVSMALLLGAAPDALVLVCNPGLKRIDPYGTPVLSYQELIRVHETILATVKPASVVGIVLNTLGMSDAQALREVERARDESGLPSEDVIRFGAQRFYEAIAPALQKRRALDGTLSAAATAKPAG